MTICFFLTFFKYESHLTFIIVGQVDRSIFFRHTGIIYLTQFCSNTYSFFVFYCVSSSFLHMRNSHPPIFCHLFGSRSWWQHTLLWQQPAPPHRGSLGVPRPDGIYNPSGIFWASPGVSWTCSKTSSGRQSGSILIRCSDILEGSTNKLSL